MTRREHGGHDGHVSRDDRDGRGDGFDAVAAPAVDAVVGASGVCVLDIETRLSEEAMRLVVRGQRVSIDRLALQELRAVSLLVADRAADGRWGGLALTSLTVDPDSEADVLARLDALLSASEAKGATLVTYNGAGHDLPVLRRRADRHWMFSVFGCERWFARGAPGHVDLIGDVAGRERLVSLIDACAGLGIPAIPVRSHLGEVPEAAVVKGQVDVVVLFLLHLYSLARKEGSAAPLSNGWPALAAFIRRAHPRAAHLAPFADHPFVGVARRLQAVA